MILPQKSLIFLPGLDQVGSTPASRLGCHFNPKPLGRGGMPGSGGRMERFPTSLTFLGTWGLPPLHFKVMGISVRVQDQVTDPDLQISIPLLIRNALWGKRL